MPVLETVRVTGAAANFKLIVTVAVPLPRPMTVPVRSPVTTVAVDRDGPRRTRTSLPGVHDGSAGPGHPRHNEVRRKAVSGPHHASDFPTESHTRASFVSEFIGTRKDDCDLTVTNTATVILENLHFKGEV